MNVGVRDAPGFNFRLTPMVPLSGYPPAPANMDGYYLRGPPLWAAPGTQTQFSNLDIDLGFTGAQYATYNQDQGFPDMLHGQPGPGDNLESLFLLLAKAKMTQLGSTVHLSHSILDAPPVVPPFLDSPGLGPAAKGVGMISRFSMFPRQLGGGSGGDGSQDFAQALGAQWADPSDVSTILMVIGGDVVQKALAQGTGIPYFTPVCFSFGWVSYAFIALVEIIGDGRLLPPSDYPVKVINLGSGYARENKNWVVGRILRDLEASLSKEEPLEDDGIRIAVFEATKNPHGVTEFAFTGIHVVGLVLIALQLGLAAIPIGLSGEWDVMLITAVGTLLVQMAGCLPQWRAEKLPNRQHKSSVFALTQGNGSREIVVIMGKGNCLDLEELAASGSPRSGRIWEKFGGPLLSKRDDPAAVMIKNRTNLHRARNLRGFPVGFWITRVVTIAQSFLWLLLLVNLATPRNHNWVLLAIGAIGMFQNGYLAGMERPSKRRNVPLERVETFQAKKVMDCIMDYHAVYGNGTALLKEFFPGDLRPLESAWWAGETEGYDAERRAVEWRGNPRSNRENLYQAEGKINA
ncbi:hypothetical protein GQ53DRAFT_812287 [Thozetella sp. PMI_491]|nr:hypothetical protein GQ53DRAFT_812287 [Thozetella sp. PMI_491]